MRSLGVVMAVARKDLLAELRGRELLPALAQFVVLALVVATFAFDADLASGPRVAGGVLWLVVVFAGLVAFGRTFASERELGTLEAVLLTGAGPIPVFLGKTLAAAAVLAAVEAVLLPALAVFLRLPLDAPMAAGVLLTVPGMAALGSLFGALAARTRARDLVMPVLAIPLWIPFVLVGAHAVAAAAAGSALDPQVVAWLLVLDLLFVLVSATASQFVLED